ncbi:MAG: HD domain-containing protein [Bacteroidales bacterium]|nr:HD domain-containing protein [Bacteroidales bacterium]
MNKSSYLDINRFISDRIFSIIADSAYESGVEAYVIGGYVRDCLLGRDYEKRDIDIVVDGSGIELAIKVARRISPGIKITVYKNFGTAMFRTKGHIIEFVGARKESYSSNSRKPVVENGTLEDDQNRRDFTINALAISLNRNSYGKLIDPFNGIKDLDKRIIRTPLEPGKTFSDDPLRMLRAIRFACQLEFDIHPATFKSIKNNAERISIVSYERITIELNKILLSNKPSEGFRLLYESSLLKIILPEVYNLKGVEMIEKHGHKDNFEHTLQVVDNISIKSDSLWLRWAALLHDIAKPKTKKYIEGTGWTFHGHEYVGSRMVPGIFKRLKLPMDDRMRYVQKLVALHLRPIILSQESVTDSAVRRLLFDAGDDIDDLMMLCEADITSKNEKKVKQHLRNFSIVRQKLTEIEEKDHVRNFQPPIDGNKIIQMFDLKPGRQVGYLKESIKEAILDGIIPNDHEAAMDYLIKKAAEIGLKPVDK